MSEFSDNNLSTYFPAYLTDHQKVALTEALKSFSAKENVDYYLCRGFEHEMLQGDVWTELDIFDIDREEGKKIKGLILSNSCDVSEDNQRLMPFKISFVPIIELNRYEQLMMRVIGNAEAVRNKVESIKKQDMTNMFFLPAGNVFDVDHVALFDDVHCITAEKYKKAESRKKISTLSMFGFYLLILKLSIHFCRMHENVDRSV